MEDAFQGLDQQSLFTPITKKTWTIKNSKIIPDVMSDAFILAMNLEEVQFVLIYQETF